MSSEYYRLVQQQIIPQLFYKLTLWQFPIIVFHQEKMILDQRYADSLIHVLPGENLFDTYSRKLQIYKPIQTAPKKYTASGWTV